MSNIHDSVHAFTVYINTPPDIESVPLKGYHFAVKDVFEPTVGGIPTTGILPLSQDLDTVVIFA